MVKNMLEIIAFATWTVFVAYATWYFTSAKHTTPISPDEARLLWKITSKPSVATPEDGVR
jgi:hypothetical protein